MANYNNFAEAWEAWLSLYSAYTNEYTKVSDGLGDISGATTWSQLRTATRYTCEHLRNLMGSHCKPGRTPLGDEPHFTAVWYAWEEGGAVDPYVLTMQRILDAIWDSTPLETFFFVNDIDAMRAAIWNKEISAEKLQELYRHFSI